MLQAFSSELLTPVAYIVHLTGTLHFCACKRVKKCTSDAKVIFLPLNVLV